MKLDIKRNNKRIAKAYFVEDFEEKNGIETPFWMVVTPLDLEDEPFYYLREDEEGIHIMGEGWIIYNKAEALEFVAKKRAEIEDVKKITFQRINKEGELI